jgi:hypothetical protein
LEGGKGKMRCRHWLEEGECSLCRGRKRTRHEETTMSKDAFIKTSKQSEVIFRNRQPRVDRRDDVREANILDDISKKLKEEK